jgi:hypothetical protein
MHVLVLLSMHVQLDCLCCDAKLQFPHVHVHVHAETQRHCQAGGNARTCLELQGAQQELDKALEEVNSVLQQAALHLQGVRKLAAACTSPNATQRDAVSADRQQQLRILEEHLLKTLVVPAADAALVYAAVHVSGCLGAQQLAPVPGSLHLTATQRQSAVESLPLDLRKPAAKLVEVCCLPLILRTVCLAQCMPGDTLVHHPFQAVVTLRQ